jgi:hypothetical protein
MLVREEARMAGIKPLATFRRKNDLAKVTAVNGTGARAAAW